MPRDFQLIVIGTYGTELGNKIIDAYSTYFVGYSSLSNKKFLANCKFVVEQLAEVEVNLPSSAMLDDQGTFN